MKAPVRRIRLVLAYDGTDYAGWQVQPSLPTIQGEVQAVLSTIQGGGRVSIRGAGRTDTGVHALGQVADGLVTTSLDDAGLLRALRAMLSGNIRPLLLETVDDDFHSRKDAISKTYTYTLDRTEYGDPFMSRFALHHPYRIDMEAIEKGVELLPGKKDWSGFAGAACPPGNRIRNLQAVTMDSVERRLVFRFTADGFLNHMVRNLVGTLLEIGRGRFASSVIEKILSAGDRRLAGPTAPARGLHLEAVRYAGLPDPPIPSDVFTKGR